MSSQNRTPSNDKVDSLSKIDRELKLKKILLGESKIEDSDEVLLGKRSLVKPLSSSESDQ